jgi:hypothetical protein
MALLSCGGGSTTAQPEYRGTASDENYKSIVDALNSGPASTDPAHASTLDEPSGTISSDTPATFTWTNPDPTAPPVEGGCANQPALAVYTGLSIQHCPTLTGYVYWLQLDSIDGFDGVLTSNTSWTPDADTWAKITANPGPITGSLLTIYFTANVVDSGPWTSPISFTLQ